MVVTIISREEWGAEEPKVRRPLPVPVTNVAIQHFCPVALNKRHLWKTCTTQDECMDRCRIIQKMAFDFDQSDLNFNFLVGGDLNVYEGRGWRVLLTEDSYWDGIRIGLIGRWPRENPAPERMLEKAHELIDYGKKRLFIKQDAYIFDMLRLRLEPDE